MILSSTRFPGLPHKTAPRRSRRAATATEASTAAPTAASTVWKTTQALAACGTVGVTFFAILQPWTRLGVLEKKVDGIETDIKELRTDMNAGFKELRTDMNDGFSKLRQDMNAGFKELASISASKPSRAECAVYLGGLVVVGAICRYS